LVGSLPLHNSCDIIGKDTRNGKQLQNVLQNKSKVIHSPTYFYQNKWRIDETLNRIFLVPICDIIKAYVAQTWEELKTRFEQNHPHHGASFSPYFWPERYRGSVDMIDVSERKIPHIYTLEKEHCINLRSLSLSPLLWPRIKLFVWKIWRHVVIG
jgi:hypothetical protein